jgi:DNA-binding beta-propeller fold protein YncE
MSFGRWLLAITLLSMGLLVPRKLPGDPPGPLAGQAVYVADSADDRVLRFIDRDGSGSVEPESPGEVVVFYDDSSPGPDLSSASALAVGPGGELYLLDGGTLNAVIVLTDLDGDGSANGEGEWRVFYDSSSPGPNLSTPGSMAFGPDGALYVADDGSSAQFILRLEDLDGDGSANGASEWKYVYKKTALSPAEGPLLDIEAIAILPDGRLLAADSTLGRIYLLTDRNGNGDFLDEGEVTVFYDPLGAFPFTRLRGLAVGPEGEVYAASINTGLILRLKDLDSNGDAMGPGEATVFLDPTLPPALHSLGDVTVAPGGTLLVLDTTHDAVFLVRDLDQDGLASTDGEVVSWILDNGLSLSTPSAVAVGPAPVEEPVRIQSLLPGSGPVGGGTRVHITGRFLAPETATVFFAGAAAEVLAAAEGSIDCRTPPGPEGPAEVRVATSAGQAILSEGYHYEKGSLFVRGDANLDGVIDISDAVGVLAYLFLGGAPPPCADAFDADDDGNLSITDPIFLLNFLFQGGASIPPPFPEPGLDATADRLGCTG